MITLRLTFNSKAAGSWYINVNTHEYNGHLDDQETLEKFARREVKERWPKAIQHLSKVELTPPQKKG